MAGRTAQVRVGGQTYRVVTTATDEELKHLAGVVDRTISGVSPAGRPVTPQTMLLAAMALAHELERERGRTRAVSGAARKGYARLLACVDEALGRASGETRAHAAEPGVWAHGGPSQPANE
jgi:cell division protein ZapA